jgi:hypothetical protein
MTWLTTACTSAWGSASRSRRFGRICLLALLGGCTSIGPGSVTRDRFDYVTAVSESWKRQMLLNMVKVRYADAPVFLDVAQVVNSYTLESEIQLFAQGASTTSGAFRSLTGTGRYSDAPTISYTPLSGEKFAKSIMSPIPLTAAFVLVQGGYPVDLVMRLCVKRIAGLENAYGGWAAPPGDPHFAELIALMRQEQLDGGPDLQLRSVEGGHEIVLTLRETKDPARLARKRRMAELMGLRPTDREFRIVPGTLAGGPGQIPIQTRSMLQVLIDVASYVQVPERDLAEGRVQVPARTAEQEKLFPALLRVHYAAEQPKDGQAHAAIRYRDGWFYIEDRDVASKAVFSFLMLMFSMTESDVTPAPVLTIPTR